MKDPLSITTIFNDAFLFLLKAANISDMSTLSFNMSESFDYCTFEDANYDRYDTVFVWTFFTKSLTRNLKYSVFKRWIPASEILAVLLGTFKPISSITEFLPSPSILWVWDWVLLKV